MVEGPNGSEVIYISFKSLLACQCQNIYMSIARSFKWVDLSYDTRLIMLVRLPSFKVS